MLNFALQLRNKLLFDTLTHEYFKRTNNIINNLKILQL